LYCATFYCALRASVRDDETRNYSIPEAHDLATRVQEFPNATKGYRIFEIQHALFDTSRSALIEKANVGTAR
jgi:hypothetical protein